MWIRSHSPAQDRCSNIWLQSNYKCKSKLVVANIYAQVMREKSREMDLEIHFKDAFRAFSKDDEGPTTIKLSVSVHLLSWTRAPSILRLHSWSCILISSLRWFPAIHVSSGCIPADELKFVMNHLPGKVEPHCQHCHCSLWFLSWSWSS